MGGEVNGFDPVAWLDAATAIEVDLGALTSSLSEAQFHAPPRSGGWSAGFCVEHLILTGQLLLHEWDLALSRHPSSNGSSSGADYTWWQRRLLRYAEDPGHLKLKASSQAVPYLRRTIDQTRDGFLDMHREISRRVAATRGLDLRRIKVHHTLVGWMQHSLDFSFDLTLAHERRHLRQAWRVRHYLLHGF
ncbi:MAG: DinB family protein [Paludibaculum sp.]